MEEKRIIKTMMTLKDKEEIKEILMERRIQRNQEINTLEEKFKKQVNELKTSLNSKR
ncbi:hypothetical protein [Priestia megaterium]|uniref:hypothetical protein n=1 Tax=Priestia megaterium TaxID=1404 RepID=UPI001494334B|nr:hypothetical protein [Priestia megaterium]